MTAVRPPSNKAVASSLAEGRARAGRRPESIAWNAWPKSTAISSTRRTVPHHLVTG